MPLILINFHFVGGRFVIAKSPMKEKVKATGNFLLNFPLAMPTSAGARAGGCRFVVSGRGDGATFQLSIWDTGMQSE